jgi:hypothetical protein
MDTWNATVTDELVRDLNVYMVMLQISSMLCESLALTLADWFYFLQLKFVRREAY